MDLLLHYFSPTTNEPNFITKRQKNYKKIQTPIEFETQKTIAIQTEHTGDHPKKKPEQKTTITHPKRKPKVPGQELTKLQLSQHLLITCLQWQPFSQHYSRFLVLMIAKVLLSPSSWCTCWWKCRAADFRTAAPCSIWAAAFCFWSPAQYTSREQIKHIISVGLTLFLSKQIDFLVTWPNILLPNQPCTFAFHEGGSISTTSTIVWKRRV